MRAGNPFDSVVCERPKAGASPEVPQNSQSRWGIAVRGSPPGDQRQAVVCPDPHHFGRTSFNGGG